MDQINQVLKLYVMGVGANSMIYSKVTFVLFGELKAYPKT